MPWVDFVKGQRKDDVMHEHLAKFEAAGRTEVVLFVGRAQEKTGLFPQPAWTTSTYQTAIDNLTRESGLAA